MVNELTGVKVTYGYDEFSNLVWSNQGGQFDFLHRSVDDVGNLYETKEKTDRVYGAGSRLLETKEAIFSYDDEGNLIQKVEQNGDTWKYAADKEEIKISTTQKFELIHQIIEKYQLKRMVRYLCEMANVSRSGYYRYFREEAVLTR